MSGHNPPHGRLGQPNASWNPLQVPSYVPRQPQLAHMSSERPMARSPLTWHTPPTHQDKMYRCTTGNLINNLEINPLLQGYGRNVGMPLGSVDLSLSSASRSTPSPKSTHTNVLAPQSTQSSGSSSSTLPPNIPSSNVCNMAGDSGQHNANHQARTAAASNPSGGVIQSTPTVAALKDRMQGATYLAPASGNAINCFAGNTNAIADSGGNGFGADLSNRSGNDTSTLLTGGLLIKDAKQINSEMEGKNGRDCFTHLPTADSAELVKEFIMQTMQSSNALSVSPKRSSPTRSSLQTIPSPSRSRSPPLNLLLGVLPIDAKLGADCLTSINLPVPNSNITANTATESTDSGTSSGAAISMGTRLLDTAGPNTAGLSAMPSNKPATSPTNTSITSSEDSIDSLNGRTSTRRRRKPERTSKMNASLGDGSNAFFPTGKTFDDTAIADLEPVCAGSIVRSDISALAIEGINALSHAIATNNNPCSDIVRISSVHNRDLRSHKNPAITLDPPSAASHHLPDNLIQSNIHLSPTKMDSSLDSSSLGAGATGGNGITVSRSTDAKAACSSASDAVSAGGMPMSAVGFAAGKISSTQPINATHSDTINKIASIGSDTITTKSMANSSVETFTGNGIVDGLDKNSNGPTPSRSEHREKSAHKQQGDKTNASDSSYEEVENKLEEMFAGIDELPVKTTDSGTRREAGTAKDNGCQLDTANQLTARKRSQPTVSDGDVLKQLSIGCVSDEEVKDACSIDACAVTSGGTKSGKKPLTPAQKRGNGSKSSGADIFTSTPAKRKRAPKKKSNAQNKPCPFPSPESPALVGLMALGKKNKKEKKRTTTSGGGEGGGRSAFGVGRKGKVEKKAKGGNKNNETAGVWSSNAPSIEPNGKYKGPYLQVKSDGSHTVINTPINEEDSEKAQNKTKKFGNSLNSSDRSKIRGLHVSTLSTKYDADTTDTSWMCVFCKTGPHKFRLGDLFGPYIISTTSSEYQQSQVDMDFFSVKRTRGTLESQHAKEIREQQKQLQELGASKGKKRKNAAGSSTVVQTPNPSGSKMVPLKQEKSAPDHSLLMSADMHYGMVKAGDNTYEVWTHEDCLIWAPGVHMVGTRIVGLEAAIWNCCRHQCELCTHYGAVLSCLRQGCSSKAHFICAHKQNWKMSREFQSFCHLHGDNEELATSAQSPTCIGAVSSVPVYVQTAKQPRKDFKSDKDAVNLTSRVS